MQIVDLSKLHTPSGKIDAPTLNPFQPGTMAIDRIGDNRSSFLYVLRMVDPDSIDYTEKWENEETVLNREDTQRYIEWYRAGHLPMPVTVVFQQVTKRFSSTNRRRVLAARAAGVKAIPAWVEIGKAGDILDGVRALEDPSPTTLQAA
jgi:hypothetical protein